MISFYNSHNRHVFSNPYRNSLEIMSRFGNISWDPNNPTYERTSRAPKRKQLSASIASKANYNPIYEQIIFQPSIDIPKLYQLQYIIDAEPENAKEAEDLVKQYIERILSTTEPEIDMLARKKAKLSTEVRLTVKRGMDCGMESFRGIIKKGVASCRANNHGCGFL